MKRTDRLSKVALIPLVAIVLVAWFTMPGVRGEYRAAADEEPTSPPLCPEGQTCGIIDLGGNGGCVARNCCPEGDHYCNGESQSPQSFPRVIRRSTGNCVGPGGDPEDFCERYTFGDAYLCSEGTCRGQGLPDMSQRRPPIVYGACGGETE